MTTQEVNLKLRRFLELGCEGLSTIGWEMARLSLQPVVLAHEEGALARLSSGEIARVNTAGAALVSTLDYAPAGLHDAARSSLIERARPSAALLELHAMLLRDRALPAAYASEDLHAAVGVTLLPLAEEIHTDVPSQTAAQARLDACNREFMSIVHDVHRWMQMANWDELSALEVDAFVLGQIDFIGAGERLMSQDDVRARWMAASGIPESEPRDGMSLPDARATLGLADYDGFDRALGRFRASVIGLLPDLVPERSRLDGPRQRWLQLCSALDAVARSEDVPTTTLASTPATLSPNGQSARDLGHYVLGEVLGRGGMGTVYRGTDRRSGEVVAVKVLEAGLAADGRFIRRFEREVLASQAVDHPALVSVREFDSHAGTAFLISDLIAGSDLACLLRSEGALRPARATRLLADIASGLAALHARGIIHRDVKPSNILVEHPGTADERALLSDFGVARITGTDLTLTQPGVVLGTPTYVAPEVARGMPAGPAADQYALACVLHETLTGRPPVGAEIARCLQPPTREALARALGPDPSRRFPNVADFARAAGMTTSSDTARRY